MKIVVMMLAVMAMGAAPVPDIMPAATTLSDEMYHWLNAKPGQKLTDVEKDKFAEEKRAKIESLSQSLMGKEFRAAGIVVDVLKSEKLERKVAAPFAAIVAIPLRQPKGTVGLWSPWLHFHPLEPASVSIAGGERCAPVVLVVIGGTENDFRAWKKGEKRMITGTVADVDIKQERTAPPPRKNIYDQQFASSSRDPEYMAELRLCFSPMDPEWVRKQSDPIEIAIREHRVIKGMTIEQGRQAVKPLGIFNKTEEAITEGDGEKSVAWDLYMGGAGVMLYRSIRARVGADGLIIEVTETKYKLPGQ